MHQEKVVEIGRHRFSRWRGGLLVGCALALVTFTGCGQSKCDWPEGTGYVTPAKKRPASPHDVKKTSTVAEINEVGSGQFLLGEKTEMEYRESQPLLVFPGAKITYLCKNPETYEMEDYNGDACVLPYGITVRVDDYGQFIPIWYKPQ